MEFTRTMTKGGLINIPAKIRRSRPFKCDRSLKISIRLRKDGVVEIEPGNLAPIEVPENMFGPKDNLK